MQHPSRPIPAAQLALPSGHGDNSPSTRCAIHRSTEHAGGTFGGASSAKTMTSSSRYTSSTCQLIAPNSCLTSRSRPVGGFFWHRATKTCGTTMSYSRYEESLVGLPNKGMQLTIAASPRCKRRLQLIPSVVRTLDA